MAPSTGTEKPSSTGRPHKSDFEWLRDQLTSISLLGDKSHSVDPTVYHDYGTHTALKLAGLRHATEVFANVAGSYAHRFGFGPMVYIDLFAGCGLNRLPHGDWLAGSPIIGVTAPKPFDQVICVEANEVHAAALEARLALWARNGTEVIRGSCNEKVAEIAERIGHARPLVFAVVDQEKMDIAMATLSDLSSRFASVDYFINHPRGAQRELDAAVAQGRESPKVEALTGRSLHEVLDESTGDVQAAFSGQVRQVLGKQIGNASLIRDDSARPLYFVLTFTRQTRRGSAFSAGYVAMHRRLAGVSTFDVALAMRFIKRREIDRDWSGHPAGDGMDG